MAAEPGARAPAFGRGSSSSSLPAAPTGAASPSDRKLAMQPLPDPPGAASPSPSGGAKEAQPEVPPEWQQSLANMREAASAAEALRDLVADAVFLDEEAFTSASTMDVYQSTIKIQHRRIRDMENEMAELRADVMRREAATQAQVARCRNLEKQIAELKQQVQNNERVAELHCAELLAKGKEVERLKTVIEGLTGTRPP